MLCKDYNPFAEKLLHLREFSKKDNTTFYERQNGNCAICKQHFEMNEMEADHIISWSKERITNSDNCQMLSVSCSRQK